jgi:hypothetical protein
LLIANGPLLNFAFAALISRMPWTRKLTVPVRLKNGRVLATLAEVRELLMTLPLERQRALHWRYVEEIMAEISGSPVSERVRDLTPPLICALEAEGMI